MNLTEDEKKMKRVRLVVEHGRSKSSGPDSPLMIYANLFDIETNECMISADLDYVLKACKDRKYILVK